ncbi:MAG: DUF1361 domain-containing protein [Candidatus Izemoplasma sp.]|nr:DUF1361 domain-containing protein [Candidatus Izemoplasma sp.]
MLKRNVIETLTIIGFFSIISIFTTMITNDLIHVIMIWNIWLSALVYLLATYANSTVIQKIAMPVFIIYALAWLFMFPNTFYVITDILHLTPYDFYVSTGYWTYTFVTDMSMYVALGHLFMTSLIGIYFGYQSLVLMHRALVLRDFKVSRIIFFATVSFLSSIGIVIGRFLRFNSWDILLPWHIIQRVWSEWSDFYTQFVILFFMVHLCIIFSFEYLSHKRSDF